jgi:uncharacterized protein (TIGR02246 family)
MANVDLAFLERFAEAWNRHDADAVVSMMTPDCVMCLSAGPSPAGERHEGRAAVKEAAKVVFASMPDVKWNNAVHFISGDRGLSEWRITGTRPDGKRLDALGCDVFEFRDGLIAVKNSFRKQVS